MSICFFSSDGFLKVCGVLELSHTNIYIGKRKLWERLCLSKRGFPPAKWCLLGHFNDVLSSQERRGLSSQINNREHEEFSSFIHSMNLIVVPLLNKRFSWFSTDDLAMSIIDRFLLFQNLIVE